MAWSKPQTLLHFRACKFAGISDEHRKLILRQLDHAMFDETGAEVTEPTSKSRWLDNSDFEEFMSVVERVTIKHGLGPGQVLTYEPGYWSDRQAGMLRRMRKLAESFDAQLLAANAHTEGGLLHQIRKMGGEDKSTLEQLDYTELHKVLVAFRSVAKKAKIWLKE